MSLAAVLQKAQFWKKHSVAAIAEGALNGAAMSAMPRKRRRAVKMSPVAMGQQETSALAHRRPGSTATRAVVGFADLARGTYDARGPANADTDFASRVDD